VVHLCDRDRTQPNGDTVLSLQFVTTTGDTLTLVGYGDDTGTGTWMVGSSTGRFAKATGSVGHAHRQSARKLELRAAKLISIPRAFQDPLPSLA
jgi:hypothetical protein